MLRNREKSEKIGESLRQKKKNCTKREWEFSSFVWMRSGGERWGEVGSGGVRTRVRRDVLSKQQANKIPLCWSACQACSEKLIYKARVVNQFKREKPAF